MKILSFIIYICLLNLILSGMDFICDNIYLGDKEAARDESYLKQNNITRVVNCAHELTSDYNDIRFLELNFYDDSNILPRFEVAYKFIKKQIENNILIHCVHGRNRSASLVVFYLMKEKGWDFDTCINFIKEKRPKINPHRNFENQLKDYYDKYIKNNL